MARNGPEFENVTREKQKDNPRFQFLSGGEFHSYYQYKLNLEKELCNSFYLIKKFCYYSSFLVRFQTLGHPPPQHAPPHPPPFLMPPGSEQNFMQMANLHSKINVLNEQISQSEKNLNAQKQFLDSKKKIQLEEMLKQLVHEKLNKLIRESDLNLNEFEQYISRIIQVCTKDAIAVKIFIN